MEREGVTLEKADSVGNSIARKLRAQTLLRYLGMPFQRLLDRGGGTHRFLTEKAVQILLADGFREAARFFLRWQATILSGNRWADFLWMNATHHYDPRTGKGLWIWPGAADQLRCWWNAAFAAGCKGNVKRSLFMLGACLHIVQDSCQPYHSNCVIFDGHQRYERWADRHKEEFVVSEGGLYALSSQPEGWVVANSKVSRPYLASVASEGDLAREEATRVLLPRAMRTGAGFLLLFHEATAAGDASFRKEEAASG